MAGKLTIGAVCREGFIVGMREGRGVEGRGVGRNVGLLVGLRVGERVGSPGPGVGR